MRIIFLKRRVVWFRGAWLPFPAAALAGSQQPGRVNPPPSFPAARVATSPSARSRGGCAAGGDGDYVRSVLAPGWWTDGSSRARGAGSATRHAAVGFNLVRNAGRNGTGGKVVVDHGSFRQVVGVGQAFA
jgi:hypothetical protein